MTPADAATLLDEIQRLYRQLQALPRRDHPDTTGRAPHGSAAYRALERQIRTRARRYWTLTSGRTITDAPKSTRLVETLDRR